MFLDPLGATSEENIKVVKATGSPASSGTSTPTHTASAASEKRLLKEPTSLVKDGLSSITTDSEMISGEVEKASSILPTMWLGSQSGR